MQLKRHVQSISKWYGSLKNNNIVKFVVNIHNYSATSAENFQITQSCQDDIINFCYHT